MKAAPSFPVEHLTVIAWPDETIDLVGHDARARYVETYWLGILGPSATWLLRRMADELEASPSGFIMNMPEMAQSLGVGGIGKNSPFIRALGRLVQFEMAQLQAGNILAVRRRVPSLSRRHVLRLTDDLRQKHDFWEKQQLTRAS